MFKTNVYIFAFVKEAVSFAWIRLELLLSFLSIVSNVYSQLYKGWGTDYHG